jgi:hypothetical protein
MINIGPPFLLYGGKNLLLADIKKVPYLPVLRLLAASSLSHYFVTIPLSSRKAPLSPVVRLRKKVAVAAPLAILQFLG